MKRILFSFGFCILLLNLFAQDSSHKKIVDFTFSSTAASSSEYILLFKAHIAKGWKLFSTTMKEDQPNTHIKLDSATAQFVRVIEIRENVELQTSKEPLLGNLIIRYFKDN